MSLLLADPSIQIPKKSTFICSVPSAGNIGQLATDVLLASCTQKGLCTPIKVMDILEFCESCIQSLFASY